MVQGGLAMIKELSVRTTCMYMYVCSTGGSVVRMSELV